MAPFYDVWTADYTCIRVIENGRRASSQISPSTFGGSENETTGQRGAFLGDDCGTRPVELAG